MSTTSRKLIVMSGIPGAGKTFVAEQMLAKNASKGMDGIRLSNDDVNDPENASSIAADSCFYDVYPDGYCFRNAINEMELGEDLIIIDNINLSVMDIVPYVLLAKAFGYECEIVRVSVDPQVAFSRQKRGLSAEEHAELHNEFENQKFPDSWNVRTIQNN